MSPAQRRTLVTARARWRGRLLLEWYAATHPTDETPGRHRRGTRNGVPSDEQTVPGTARPGDGS